MILKKIKPMKFRWIHITLLAFFIIGVSSFTQYFRMNEQKNITRETLNKGNYLATLLALYPITDFRGEKRDFFLKTLAEQFSSEGLVYCFILDKKGDAILSFNPGDLAYKIPDIIQNRAIYSMGLIKQTFTSGGSDMRIHDFSKPIFENGQRVGTVQLGFKNDSLPIFSKEYIGFPGMIAFFILATWVIVYYGAAFILRPIRDRYGSIGETRSSGLESTPLLKVNSGIMPIVQDLEKSFEKIREILNNADADNMEIAARLGVVTFERNQISKIINSLDVGVIITDIQENIININAYMLNLLKKARADVINRSLGEIIEDDEIRKLISQQHSGKRSGSPQHLEVKLPQYAPGKTFQISLGHLEEEDGVIISNMILIKDITGQKLLEKASQGFIAQVAHEFLTPLTTIGSYNEMLMDGEIEDREMQKEFYNTISEETGRLSRLIQNLLSLAKMEMGALTLQKGLVKTDWLVKDTIMTVEGSALKRNISIIQNMPDNFPSLVGDKELLKIAVINVLGNAVKYSPENSQITFSLMEENDMVVLDIADTGYGIAKEDLPHIFDKFYRSKESHIVEQTGSGLGLPMTAEIINLHGGEIEVQSEKAEGTKFSIRIPKEQYYIGSK